MCDLINDLFEMVLAGPEDTPYSGGCFEFDIYFPPTYPNVPMNVQLKTTGSSPSIQLSPSNCLKAVCSLTAHVASLPDSLCPALEMRNTRQHHSASAAHSP